MKILLTILLVYFTSCTSKAPAVVTTQDFETLKLTLVKRVDSQAVVVKHDILTGAIGKLFMMRVQTLSDNDSINQANIAQLLKSNSIQGIVIARISDTMSFLGPALATQSLTTKQLTDKMKSVETSLATQTLLNTKLIADTAAKGKRIIALERAALSSKNRIDTLTLIPDTTTDFMIRGKLLRIRRS